MVLKRNALAEALKAKMAELEIKTQPGFVAWLAANGCEVHQSTVSRLLNCEIRDNTRRVEEVCRYAKIPLDKYLVRPDPKTSKPLMSALAQVWNGSKPHERWLVRMIKTAGAAPPSV